MKTLVRLLAVLGVLASGSVVTVTQAHAASDPEILETGSSFAFPAIDTWRATVNSLLGINISDQDQNSVVGLNEFASNTVNIGASEIGYSTGQADAKPTNPYEYMPDVAGGLAVSYNLPGVNGLKLSAAALLGIFTNQITMWNAQQIAQDNPGVNLPNQPINVVNRADACGENYILTDYLDTLFPSQWQAFAASVGFGNQPVNAIYPFPQAPAQPFPNWTPQSGAPKAAQYVQTHKYSITYVETAWALLDNLSIASVQNTSQAWVQPTSYNVAVALTKDELDSDLEQNLAGVFTNTEPAAYPISAYSYLISYTTTINPAMGAELSNFIYYMACTGQYQLTLGGGTYGGDGYSPIPPNLVDDDFQAAMRLNGGVAKPMPTASTCKNPYIDGQIPLPGEPVVIGQSPGGGGGGGAGTGRSGSGGSTGPGGSGSSGPGGSTAPTSGGSGSPGSSTGGQTAGGPGSTTAASNGSTAGPKGSSKTSSLGSSGSQQSTTTSSVPIRPRDLVADASNLRRADSFTLPGAVGVTLLVLLILLPPLIWLVRRQALMGRK
jgi:ABC-type phosphate transport system substrate-binding protein